MDYLPLLTQTCQSNERVCTGPSWPWLAPGVNGAPKCLLPSPLTSPPPKKKLKMFNNREKIPWGNFGASNAAAPGKKTHLPPCDGPVSASWSAHVISEGLYFWWVVFISFLAYSLSDVELYSCWAVSSVVPSSDAMCRTLAQLTNTGRWENKISAVNTFVLDWRLQTASTRTIDQDQTSIDIVGSLLIN